MLCLGPQLLPLQLLHREFLPRLPSPPLSWYPWRVLLSRGLVRPLSFLLRHLLPKEGVIPFAAQIEVASPTTPLVISTSDPFLALSQAVKDGSSSVVTPSFIPSSATRGPNADLSSEGSKDVLENPDDEPTIKKRIFESDEKESVDFETEFIGMCLFLPFLLSFLLPLFLLSLFHIYTCVTFLLRFPFT